MLTAALLVAGIAVAGVRSSRTKNEAGPGGIPTASETPLQSVSETPTATESSPSEAPSPSVTMTFSGLPPFLQSHTPSPKPSSGTKLPHTGVPDGGFFASGMLMLLMALAAAGLLLREQR